jgi:WD40 repeat protein
VQRSRADRHRQWRLAIVALLLTTGVLAIPATPSEAHTCTPDTTINVTGQLVVPRASGFAVIGLSDRSVRAVPIAPSQGVATGIASAQDRGVLAVPRFWRPPDHTVGGQDILLVDPTTGTVRSAIERSQPGEALGSPAWLPDGSLVYERRLLAGANEAVRIERAQPGQPSQILAEHASSPAVSPDGASLALVPFAGTDRLYVRPVDGGAELLLVERPEILSIAFPRFSPDGAWIAFTAASEQTAAAGGLRHAVAPTDRSVGSQARSWARQSLANAISLLAPRAARAHGVPWDVWVVRPDGTDLRRVTSFADDDSSVAWSPDGRWLATFSAEAIHVVTFDGSETYCVANEGGYGAIEWLP